MLGKLRKNVGKYMERWAKRIAFIPPDIITVSVLLSSLAVVFWYWSSNPIIAGVFILLTGFLDMLDGAVARARGRATKFGAVLDATIDRYSEILMTFGIAVGGYVEWPLALIGGFSMYISSYVRARAESSGGMERCSVGIAERPEKILILGFSSIIEHFYSGILRYAVILLIVLGQLTAFQRLHAVYIFEKRDGF
ncbi:MAG TPA: CDP-alcohol phosphatidyltransferase family protein [Candidatus Bathyarchaeota archaeon]|nr:CDP-alcohol phosphatidyltransferase family protein [Candidatus Bathyarchaeota archaeon]